MDVVCHGLSLPLTEHETIKDCVSVYCDWLTALCPTPNITVPKPIVDDANVYGRKIINHFHNLFVPRLGEGKPNACTAPLPPLSRHTNNLYICLATFNLLSLNSYIVYFSSCICDRTLFIFFSPAKNSRASSKNYVIFYCNLRLHYM